MTEFDDNMHRMDVEEAASKLQWSSENSLFGRLTFSRLLSAASYFRDETEQLRAAGHTPDEVEALKADANELRISNEGATARIAYLESSLAQSDSQLVEALNRNAQLLLALGKLTAKVGPLKHVGDTVVKEVGGMTIDGQPAPWSAVVRKLDEELTDLSSTSDAISDEWLD